ncbi:MAG: glycosyltransferase family 4 protein [Desulfomonilaceae bacterium]
MAQLATSHGPSHVMLSGVEGPNMKVAAYLDQKIHSGGGFQQSLNAALQIQDICVGMYEFSVYTSIKSNIKVFEGLGIRGIYCPESLLDKLFVVAPFSTVLHQLVGLIGLVSSFEKRLIRDGVDLVYFLAPSRKAPSMQSLNYIFTVWDICHRDFPEFPEVRSFGTFERRELLYKSSLGKAYLVIADSNELRQKIQSYYSIDPDRILLIPFRPPLECASATDDISNSEVLSQYNINPGYLFYPAQFWSHKGHVRLLEAIAIFREKNGYAPSCVFCGGDKGNLEAVSRVADKLCLVESVKFLGFVPSQQIPALYRSASALVMPTYFGPTNLPPLEGLSVGVPVIYPRHLKEQCGDAAIYFDVDDSASLCEAIEKVLLEKEKNHRPEAGRKKLELMAAEIKNSEEEFARRLQTFEKRLTCWKT